jgi:hypothetical protein
MINRNDLYTFTESFHFPTTGQPIGTLALEYTVRAYMDVRNLKTARAYLITCKQRITIPNETPFVIGPASIKSFLKYPAAVTTRTAPATKSTDALVLLDYSPKTLNTAITSSTSASDSQGTSSSNQYTSGSSTAVTNSYDVSVNVGSAGSGVSASRGHSETNTSEQSQSLGHSSEAGSDATSSSSMTIKDWASYASLDPTNTIPSWTWGQEYPWDVLALHNTGTSQHDENDDPVILLPPYVQDRLHDGSQALPPSKTSLFGINFVSKSKWLYTPADNSDDSLTFEHTVNYITASHSVESASSNVEGDPPKPKVYDVRGQLSLLLTFPFTSPTPLDLPTLSLDPISSEGASNGAIVGFVKSQFVVQPSPGSDFRIKSASNNLYVTGSGFDPSLGSDSPMSATLNAAVAARMVIKFKIDSEDEDYTLLMKHWKIGQSGTILGITINDNDPIVRHVDATESGSGADNVTSIILRDRDYTSAEFYDYLVMGLNTISIDFAPAADPMANGSPARYAIRALAIS